MTTRAERSVGQARIITQRDLTAKMAGHLLTALNEAGILAHPKECLCTPCQHVRQAIRLEQEIAAL